MTRLSLERTIPLVILFAGFLIALVFCFLVYPKLQRSYHAVLDPDDYGILGMNVLHGNGLAFDPDEGPTVYRGPLYPVFIALALGLGNEWYPGSVWIAQCLLHGLTCVFIYLLVKIFVSRNRAAVIGFCCACYPVLFWFAPRMWNEMLLMFFMVCLLYVVLRFFEKPKIPGSIGIGVITGLMCLTKATFLVLIIAVPLCFLIFCPLDRLRHILLMVFATLIIVLPWTVRNYILVKRIIPVHTGAGFNIKVGNAIARSYFSEPLAYSVLWDKNIDQIQSLTANLSSKRPLLDIQEEDIFMASALDELRKDFGLLVKRVMVNGLNFWYIGETRLKSIVLILLKLPIIVLAIISIIAGLKMGEKRIWIFLIIMLVYWIAHFPFAANGRLSGPLMPLIMLIALSDWRRGSKSEEVVI